MIVIRVELWPGGDHGRRKTIAVGTIANVGGTHTRGEYEARFFGAGNGEAQDIAHVYDRLATRGNLNARTPWRVAFVKNFPRKRQGAWVLLWLALMEACGGLKWVA